MAGGRGPHFSLLGVTWGILLTYYGLKHIMNQDTPKRNGKCCLAPQGKETGMTSIIL